MSKKKVTLKDLDAFLKQQAASLVTPPKVSDQIDEPTRQEESPPAPTITVTQITPEQMIVQFRALCRKEGSNFRKTLYDVILQTLEHEAIDLPEDKMLINTLLYLKHGDNWKAAIQQYWQRHKK